jgi:hypothetical protein
MGYTARRSKRFLPKNSVTVALLDDDYPVGYGVIRDISEAGACIVTDAPLQKDRDLQFKMSFYREGMLAAGGRVVWSMTSMEHLDNVQASRHGVQFTKLSKAERRLLQRILDSSTFGVSAD